jgi:hypothetical protein
MRVAPSSRRLSARPLGGARYTTTPNADIIVLHNCMCLEITTMNNAPENSTVQSNPYRWGATILFVLALISVGTSNILGYLAAPALARIEPISLVLIPVYIGTAFFTRRQSLAAYRLGMLAFIVSGVIGLVMSFLNIGTMSAVVGGSGFAGITLLNIIYVLVVAALLLNVHKAILHQERMS